MSEHTFLVGAFSIFGLLTLATIVHWACKKLRLPFAVGLLIAGLWSSALIQTLSWQEHLALTFSPEIVFYIFLPTLIFESAYHLNFRQLKGVLREVTSLATVGLIFSILIVAAGMHIICDWPLIISLLFGAIVSATDPVAVLAVFKELKVPQKLNTIVDGESLLNDGTALVLFQFFLGLALASTSVIFTPLGIAQESFSLLWSLILGIAFGALSGVIFSLAIARSESKGVKLTLSLVLAHLTFLIAEGLLGVSGILATMAAGLVMGNFGQRKLKPQSRHSFNEIWHFLGFLSNALIFLLLGIRIGEINFLQYWYEIIWAVVITVFIARIIPVFLTFWFTNKSRPKDLQICTGYQWITFWGGIRGALAATAVLLIPVDFEYAAQLQAMTAGVIIFTFLVNGTTIGWWLRKLKIVSLTGSEKMQKSEARLVVNQEVTHYLDSLLKRKYISENIYSAVKDQYLKEHSLSPSEITDIEENLKDNQREFTKILTHYALGIELKTYNQLFAMEEITESRFIVLQQSIHRQLGRLERDLLPEERSVTYKYAPSIPKHFWLSTLLQKYGFTYQGEKILKAYKKSRILARLQHYRARRIASWKVIQDFKQLQKDHVIFADSPIVKKIITRYNKWHLSAEKKMQALENKFPETVTQMRIQIAKRSCLEKEKKIEAAFLEKGFISEKIHGEFNQHLEEKLKSTRHKSWFHYLFEH